jgi:hypothetical protein
MQATSAWQPAGTSRRIGAGDQSSASGERGAEEEDQGLGRGTPGQQTASGAVLQRAAEGQSQAAWTESGTGQFPVSVSAGGVNRRRDRGSGGASRLPELRRSVGGGSRRVGDHDRSSSSTATASHPLPRTRLPLPPVRQARERHSAGLGSGPIWGHVTGPERRRNGLLIL